MSLSLISGLHGMTTQRLGPNYWGAALLIKEVATECGVEGGQGKGVKGGVTAGGARDEGWVGGV